LTPPNAPRRRCCARDADHEAAMPEPDPAPFAPPRAIQRLQTAQLRLAAVALVTMMTGTVLDVFFRYAFNKPLRISYDLVESMLVIYVFHGISSVFLARRNIVIDVIDSMISPRVLRILAATADLVSILCLLLFLWGMIQPAMQAFQYGDRKLELGLPLYVLWGFALAGLLGTLVCALFAFTHVSLRQLRSHP
jgi:TRAP-type C4-dicarboxylate transport system permease small subunit